VWEYWVIFVVPMLAPVAITLGVSISVIIHVCTVIKTSAEQCSVWSRLQRFLRYNGQIIFFTGMAQATEGT
jgi:hypothetical protein